MLTPGVFESILVLEKPGDSEDEGAKTVADIDSVIDDECIKELVAHHSIHLNSPRSLMWLPSSPSSMVSLCKIVAQRKQAIPLEWQ